MASSKDRVKPFLISTERQIRRFSKTKWIQLRYLPTPGIKKSWGYLHMVPPVYDWRFSPSGRTGVSIDSGFGAFGFDVHVLDVHTKLWFGHSIRKDDIEFGEIFTYHMVNETTLIVVQISDNNLVKQHVVRVNLERREAERIATEVHEFLRRDILPDGRPPWQPDETHPNPHVPVTVGGKSYTALVSGHTFVDNRRMIYLVPRHPFNYAIQPIEFSILPTVSPEDEQKIKQLTGFFYHAHKFCYSAFSSEGLLHFTPSISSRSSPLTFTDILLGVYLTIDVSKLVDVHNKRIGNMEQMDLDDKQANSMKLISYPFAKLVESSLISFSCGLDGAVVFVEPMWTDRSKRSFYITCHVLGLQRILRIKTARESWLNLHPCGALLQFTRAPRTLEMHVRVASNYKLSLASLTSSKLIFQPNRPINSLEGLHQIIFPGQKPIALDEKAKKALRTYAEYLNILTEEEDSRRIKKKDIIFTMVHQPKMKLRSLAFWDSMKRLQARMELDYEESPIRVLLVVGMVGFLWAIGVTSLMKIFNMF